MIVASKILPDEKHLLSLVALGDVHAFSAIYHHYNRSIYPFVLKITKSETLAEEIIQEVFISVWVNRTQMTQVENFRAYIYTIATNKTLNYFKKAVAETRRILHVSATSAKVSNVTEEEIFAKESESLVQAAVESLPEQRKKIYKLSRHEGLTHEQIADKLNISKNTVKNQLVEALKFIRHYLNKNNEIPLAITFMIVKSLK
ncbi:RNA polymerase sigma-70 factor [Chitinophagaceae bacterium 26-R-25]|nr:RNA polymerase sigma-70 factor [Chitinophagaceae bacterium 26-R-25]